MIKTLLQVFAGEGLASGFTTERQCDTICHGSTGNVCWGRPFMWVKIKTTSNLIVGEAWKELFEDAGVPCQLRWDDPRFREDANAPCDVMVPTSRYHVAEHVLSRC